MLFLGIGRHEYGRVNNGCDSLEATAAHRAPSKAAFTVRHAIKALNPRTLLTAESLNRIVRPATCFLLGTIGANALLFAYEVGQSSSHQKAPTVVNNFYETVPAPINPAPTATKTIIESANGAPTYVPGLLPVGHVNDPTKAASPDASRPTTLPPTKPHSPSPSDSASASASSSPSATQTSAGPSIAPSTPIENSPINSSPEASESSASCDTITTASTSLSLVLRSVLAPNSPAIL